MKNPLNYLFVLLLSLALGLMGCPPTGDDDASGDDDDASGDDDDASGDDDDDDDCENDEFDCGDGQCVDEDEECDGSEDCDNGEDEEDCGDDDVPDGMTFTFQVTVLAPGSESEGRGPGDDDDSAGDDDDSAGDDDDSTPAEDNYQVQIEYVVRYYSDFGNNVPLCDQHLTVDGEAWFGFGVMADDCANCTGYFLFDPETVLDISNPAVDPDHCDPVVLDDLGFNYGMALLVPTDPQTQGNFGDWLSMGLVDVESMGLLGLSMDQDGGLTAEALTKEFLGYDLEFTHAGYTNNVTGTLGAGSGLDQVAENAGGTSSWYAFWQLYKNPATNPHEGLDMNGDYGGGAAWVITFQQQ